MATEFIRDGELAMHPSLDSSLEQADVRIISHCLDFVRSGLPRLLTLKRRAGGKMNYRTAGHISET